MMHGDPAQFGKVGLVIGGQSEEREVSLNGGKAIAAALGRLGVDHAIFDGPAALLDGIREQRIDRVFNLLHGPGGEDGTLQGALSLLGIPVTGSDVKGSALTMDKVRSKWIWQRCDISTPDFHVLGAGRSLPDEVVACWGFPLFVKPVGQGSSIGVSKVKRQADLQPAIALARQYGAEVIVEPAIDGDEYFAGIVGDVDLPLIRIETPREFYDYQAKYESGDTQYFCPCGLDADLEDRLRQTARRAFDLTGAGGWGRVDFLLDRQGIPWFLEVNTTPGMTDHSLVPQAAVEIGIGFDELVWKILETSLEDRP